MIILLNHIEPGLVKPTPIKSYMRYSWNVSVHIGKKRGDFIAAVNRLNYVFSTAQSEVKLSLLQTYSTAWYGCQAWQLGTTLADEMNVEWNKVVQRTAGLVLCLNCANLHALCGNWLRINTIYITNNKTCCFGLNCKELVRGKCTWLRSITLTYIKHSRLKQKSTDSLVYGIQSSSESL